MTTNFDFVPESWGDSRADAVRAESYGRSDPRTCVFYARRVVEQVVVRVFDLEQLPVPYKSDLAARIADAGFRAAVGPDLARRADAIRKVGNVAVHENRVINEQTALNTLRQLYDVLRWAAFNYSTEPEAVPTSVPFDPSLIPMPAQGNSEKPLSTEELNRLLKMFEEKDAALQAEKATSTQLQYQLEQARRELAEAQAKKAHLATQFNWDEAATRDLFIDVACWRPAGRWTPSATASTGSPACPTPRASATSTTSCGATTACRWRWSRPSAPRRDPAVGQQQAKLYADCLEQMTGRRPVIFYTNGYEHWLWDDAAGYPPRQVQGFFTERRARADGPARRTRLPLAGAAIDKAIVERHYQHRAIRAVDEAFDRQAARGAAGDGDRLRQDPHRHRAGRPADEGRLGQAGAVPRRPHRPGQPGRRRVQDAPARTRRRSTWSTEKVADGRVYVSTYPTMMNLINEHRRAASGASGPATST